MLRVLLDATAVPPDRGGVGRYVDAIVPELARLAAVTVACRPSEAESFAAVGAEPVTVPASSRGRGARLAWEQTGLVRLVRRIRPDVLHSPHYTTALRSGVPTVVTLHDATFFSHPEVHSAVKRRFFRLATQVAVRRADVLVVPSRATATEVARYTGAAPDAFEVAYHGVDMEVFRPVGDRERRRVRQSLGVTGTYVGFLGTLEPRKNVSALVRAWALAVGDRPDPPALVLAGGPGWDRAIEPAVRDATADRPDLRVIRPGYLPLSDLPGFLSGAEVLAYPSLGEGFGLPVLEAMATGAVVLTTRMLALPEVGGDAVAYAGTSDVEIAAALADLLEDPARRAALASAALTRARGFTWAASAQAHLAAYERAVFRRRSA